MDANGVIKVADFGLSAKIYTSAYYRQTETDTAVKLPVRWMPPESITDGIFTEKSDIVSEITTAGMQHPSPLIISWDTSISIAVVIWSDMLGGVHWGTHPL